MKMIALENPLESVNCLTTRLPKCGDEHSFGNSETYANVCVASEIEEASFSTVMNIQIGQIWEGCFEKSGGHKIKVFVILDDDMIQVWTLYASTASLLV
uniref:Uncharacterized protein n=1 Tax=Caenorhabditis japonica TaxID=281687 RepID=A0A8R1E3H0_CAEJA